MSVYIQQRKWRLEAIQDLIGYSDFKRTVSRQTYNKYIKLILEEKNLKTKIFKKFVRRLNKLFRRETEQVYYLIKWQKESSEYFFYNIRHLGDLGENESIRFVARKKADMDEMEEIIEEDKPENLMEVIVKLYKIRDNYGKL